MGKKRKSDATRLDEVDRGMYTTFCSAANSLSQLYTFAMHQQRLSFHGGERHSMEKLYSWIMRQQEDGIRVMTVDIIAYIQNELDYGTDELPPSPRLPLQQLVSSNSDQTKNPVFSNALSSPVLHNYHLSQGGYSLNNSIRNNENTSNNQTRDMNPPSSNDTSMDMHADSPGRDLPY